MLKIVVPYRNREKYLREGIELWPLYFDWIKEDYKIYIIEQDNNDIFNISKLMNIGFDISKPVPKEDSFVFLPVDHYPACGPWSFNCNYQEFKILWPYTLTYEQRILHLAHQFFESKNFGFKSYSCCPSVYKDIGGSPEDFPLGFDDSLLINKVSKKIGFNNMYMEQFPCVAYHISGPDDEGQFSRQSFKEAFFESASKDHLPDFISDIGQRYRIKKSISYTNKIEHFFTD